MAWWHGVTPSSMSAFFQWEQLESGIPNRPSVNHCKAVASSLGHTAQDFTPGSAPQSGNPQTRGRCLFLHIAVPFLGSKSGPGPPICPAIKLAEKPDPIFGPPKLAWFCSGGQLAATLFSPCQVTASWRMARYVAAKFADKEGLFLNAEEI